MGSNELATPPGFSAQRFRAMGTDVHVLAPMRREDESARAVEALFAEWEGALSRFRPESGLSRLNGAAGVPVVVGKILLNTVEAALAAARATGGLFDPTLEHELVRIGYGMSFDEISVAQPARAKPRGGGSWQRIAVNRSSRTVWLPTGCGLDLGGIAKGMAVDAALARLGELGIETALVSAGGDLAVRGLPPGERAWHVLVSESSSGPVVPLVRGALATSGTTRRHWLQGITQRHHLIDPRTGEPADSGLREVTVAASTCREAEVAATAAFVAGPLLGPELLEREQLAGRLVMDSGRSIGVGCWPRPDLRAA